MQIKQNPKLMAISPFLIYYLVNLIHMQLCTYIICGNKKIPWKQCGYPHYIKYYITHIVLILWLRWPKQWLGVFHHRRLLIGLCYDVIIFSVAVLLQERTCVHRVLHCLLLILADLVLLIHIISTCRRINALKSGNEDFMQYRLQTNVLG